MKKVSYTLLMIACCALIVGINTTTIKPPKGDGKGDGGPITTEGIGRT
ncbi:hypothetical protein J2Z48_002029 [Croceifilum oryzae]|uniref:Uncharacterized protein n=1 Tax=Croceifilum oryzae TaxID=1553429 RepID=A0AAJ1TF85_9BACL|nr:hypothetical protein [Croceifilum oryzae]MDQ0417845.1 hypothetical protein [Croceifilum oryzae]